MKSNFLKSAGDWLKNVCEGPLHQRLERELCAEIARFLDLVDVEPERFPEEERHLWLVISVSDSRNTDVLDFLEEIKTRRWREKSLPEQLYRENVDERLLERIKVLVEPGLPRTASGSVPGELKRSMVKRFRHFDELQHCLLFCVRNAGDNTPSLPASSLSGIPAASTKRPYVKYGGRVFPLKSILAVGRALENDIVTDEHDRTVSRQHCSLLNGPNQITLVNRSGNSTLVNEEIVTTEVVLKNDTFIRIGDQVLEFFAPASTLATAPTLHRPIGADFRPSPTVFRPASSQREESCFRSVDIKS